MNSLNRRRAKEGCTANDFADLCRKIGKSENRDPLHVAFDYWNYAVTHAIALRRAKGK